MNYRFLFLCMLSVRCLCSQESTSLKERLTTVTLKEVPEKEKADFREKIRDMPLRMLNQFSGRGPALPDSDDEWSDEPKEFSPSRDKKEEKAISLSHLHDLMKQKKYDQLLKEVDKDSINTVDVQGRTLLHCAVEQQDISMIRKLLVKTPNLMIKDAQGNTPLHRACMLNNKNIVKELLNADARIETSNNVRLTPLHTAAKCADEDVMLLLISHDQNLDLDIMSLREGNTPLHFAAERGHEKICSMLICKGVNVSCTNHDGLLPVDLALKNGYLETAQLIEDKLSNLIHRAVVIKNLEVLKKLISLSKNLKKDVIFDHGLTALHVACSVGQKRIYDLHRGLIAGYRKVSIEPVSLDEERDQIGLLDFLGNLGLFSPGQKDAYGRTPLHIACEFGQESACRWLLSNGERADAVVVHHRLKDKKYTPLTLAASYNNVTLLRELVDHLIQQQGITYLVQNYPDLMSAAITHCSEDSVEYLLKQKERYRQEFTDHKLSYYALHHACFVGNLAICKLIINDGEDPGSTMPQQDVPERFKEFWPLAQEVGVSPLHCAAYNGHKEVCALLARKNADLNSVTSGEFTPLSLACKEKQTEVIDFLLRRKARVDVASLECASLEKCEELLESVKSRFNKIPHDERGRREVEWSIEGLLEKKDHAGKTLLARAAETGNGQKCALLLDYFASVADVDKQKRTPLHLVCMCNDQEDKLRFNGPLQCLQVMLDDELTDATLINKQDSEGKTALYYACQGGKHARVAIDMLIKAGADPNITANGLLGKSAKDIALKSSCDELKRLAQNW